MRNNALGIRTSTTVGINMENTVERNNAVGIEMKKSVKGLHLVHVSRNVRRMELREGTTGRPIAVPRIMAVAEPVRTPATEKQPAPPEPKVELAFYRKYTEAMLRRYQRLSTQVGRTPSLLGRELFRGSASHYTMTTFEDEVVFCVDVERCVARLQREDRRFIQRIAIQGYALQEAAPLLGLDFRRCHERYGAALDQLTELFLSGRLLEPLKCCQDVEAV
jgi:DNA-directed RNA polymerase specialized sigma24 family protein